jgi:hypothetical protein
MNIDGKNKTEGKESPEYQKKKKTMLLLLALVLLLICYFGLRYYNQQKEKSEEAKEEQSTVYLTKEDDLTEISYDAGNGEMHFVKEDGSWKVEADPDFPLDQDAVSTLESNLGHIQVLRELKDGDELSDYGLDDPTYWIDLEGEDGSQTRVLIGNAISSGYYAVVDGEEDVCTISSTVIEDLQSSLEDMAALDIMPDIGSGNLVEESITNPGSEEATTYSADNEDDEEAIATVAGGLGAITLQDVENYSVSDEELSQYGLDENSRTTVEVTYSGKKKDKQLTLYLGADNGSEQRYVMINDSRIVYKVSTEICNNILNSGE